jgi:hypothetical protein
LGAGQIDFAHHPLSHQVSGIGLHHLGHKFVAGSAGEGIVTALEFQIGVADARAEEPEHREPGGP